MGKSLLMRSNFLDQKEPNRRPRTAKNNRSVLRDPLLIFRLKKWLVSLREYLREGLTRLYARYNGVDDLAAEVFDRGIERGLICSKVFVHHS